MKFVAAGTKKPAGGSGPAGVGVLRTAIALLNEMERADFLRDVAAGGIEDFFLLGREGVDFSAHGIAVDSLVEPSRTLAEIVRAICKKMSIYQSTRCIIISKTMGTWSCEVLNLVIVPQFLWKNK